MENFLPVMKQPLFIRTCLPVGGERRGFFAHSWHTCCQPDTILDNDTNTPQHSVSHI